MTDLRPTSAPPRFRFFTGRAAWAKRLSHAPWRYARPTPADLNRLLSPLAGTLHDAELTAAAREQLSGFCTGEVAWV